MRLSLFSIALLSVDSLLVAATTLAPVNVFSVTVSLTFTDRNAFRSEFINLIFGVHRQIALPIHSHVVRRQHVVHLGKACVLQSVYFYLNGALIGYSAITNTLRLFVRTPMRLLPLASTTTRAPILILVRLLCF